MPFIRSWSWCHLQDLDLDAIFYMYLFSFKCKMKKTPSAERYLADIFLPVFCELLENSSSSSKCVPKGFRKFTKNTGGEILW